jgi:hypothetical protein
VSKRIEQSRKHGPFDPRYPKLVRLVTPRKALPVTAPEGPTVKVDAGGSASS